MTTDRPNRYLQLARLVPKGVWYKAQGTLLPWRSSPYELFFSPVPASTTFQVFVNEVFTGFVSSNGDGETVVLAVLRQGYNEISIVAPDGTKFPAYVSTRLSATIHAAHAETFERLDESLLDVKRGTALELASSRFLGPVFGRPLRQANDLGFLTGAYRLLVRWLRQAFRLFGAKLRGMRQGPAGYTSSSPLRLLREWRPWWRLGSSLAPIDLQTRSRALTSTLANLNARSLDFVHAAYAATAANVFPGPTGAVLTPQRLTATFATGWDGGSLIIEGTSPQGTALSETVTPVASQPLAAGETVRGTLIFDAVTSIRKTVVGTGGTASVGLDESVFVEILSGGSTLPIMAGAGLNFDPTPARLSWQGGEAVEVPEPGDYTLYAASNEPYFYGLVPEPGGDYAVGDDHYLRFVFKDEFIYADLLVDLSNESFNAGPGFAGGASPRTQAEIAATINAYIAASTDLGAIQATGAITCVAAAAIEAADGGDAGLVTIELDDGRNPALIFEFRRVATSATAGRIIAFYTSGTSAADVAEVLRDAINDGWNDTAGTVSPATVGALRIEAWIDPAAPTIVQLVNRVGGAAGNVVITQTGGAGFGLSGMAGGADALAIPVAAATSGAFSDALELRGAYTGAEASISIQPVGADAAEVVLGEPRSRALTTGALATGDLTIPVTGGRLPETTRTVIVREAFLDTSSTVTTGFNTFRPGALEVHFDAGWRGSAIQVSGLDRYGRFIQEVFTPSGQVVTSGTMQSTDGTTITLDTGDRAAVVAGMWLRRVSDDEGARVLHSRPGLLSFHVILDGTISGSPFSGEAYEVRKHVVVKGSLAFAEVQQIDVLTPEAAGPPAGRAILTVIDADTYGYDARVGQSLRASGTGGTIISLVSLGFPLAEIELTGFTPFHSDEQGFLHIQNTAVGSNANVGLHRLIEVGNRAGDIDPELPFTHQDALSGGFFASGTVGDWRVFSPGEVYRVVEFDGTDAAILPPGIITPRASGVPVDINYPFRNLGIDEREPIVVRVTPQLAPLAMTSDTVDVDGSNVPDGWRLYNALGAEITEGYIQKSRTVLEAAGADADGIGTTDMVLERTISIAAYRGFLVTVAFWGQAHATGRSFQIDVAFDGGSFTAGTPLAVAGTMFDSVASTDGGVLDPTQIAETVVVPPLADTMTIRIIFVDAATNELFSAEHITVTTAQTGLFVGQATTPLSAKRQAFGEVLYLWSPEPLQQAARRGLGLADNRIDGQPEQPGVIDRLQNAHSVCDRYDVSEFSPSNLVGCYTGSDWNNATLENMTLEVETPPRSSFVRPSDVSMVEADLTFTAPSDATLPEPSAHEGPYPEQSFADEVLFEDGAPVPAEPQVVQVTDVADSVTAAVDGLQTLTDASASFDESSVGLSVRRFGDTNAVNNGIFRVVARTATTLTFINPVGVLEAGSPGSYSVGEQGVLPWRFIAADEIQVASVAAGDPADEAVFEGSASYRLRYRRPIRATTPVLDLGASFADYIWFVDLAYFQRREPTSSAYARSTQLVFDAAYRSTLTVPADTAALASLYADDGVNRRLISRTRWRFLSRTAVEIDSNEFQADTIFSFEYQALLPKYPSPSDVRIYMRSNAIENDVTSEPWTETTLDGPVAGVRYHQLRVDVTGVVDTGDVQISGLGLKGLHLYGAGAFAPGIEV